MCGTSLKKIYLSYKLTTCVVWDNQHQQLYLLDELFQSFRISDRVVLNLTNVVTLYNNPNIEP